MRASDFLEENDSLKKSDSFGLFSQMCEGNRIATKPRMNELMFLPFLFLKFLFDFCKWH